MKLPCVTRLVPKHLKLGLFQEFCIFAKNRIMSALVIKTDNQNTKILKELAKKLGANVGLGITGLALYH